MNSVAALRRTRHASYVAGSQRTTERVPPAKAAALDPVDAALHIRSAGVVATFAGRTGRCGDTLAPVVRPVRPAGQANASCKRLYVSRAAATTASTETLQAQSRRNPKIALARPSDSRTVARSGKPSRAPAYPQTRSRPRPDGFFNDIGGRLGLRGGAITEPDIR